MARSPFPLQWPDGWARTRFRDRSKFDLSRGFPPARDGAYHQLDMMGASHVVITSNLPVNASGKPYTASQGNIPDPGIAVWWVSKGQERVMACDRWLSATENMHAIEKSLEAMRGLDRWGASQIVERAFAGFAALPAAPPSGPRHWLDVFDLRGLLGIHDIDKHMSKADRLGVVRIRHREMIKSAHPDVGGSHERAAELNAALTQAEKDLA